MYPPSRQLSSAIKKAVTSDEHNRRMKDLGFPVKYLSPQETATLWADTEAQIQPIINEALQTK